MQLTAADIARRLSASFDPDRPPESPYTNLWADGPPQPAAVLIPFFCSDNGWELLFIRRTLHPHDRHGGQVAYPGGRCDANDPDAVKAATREAHEEVGIHPRDVRILGQLQDMLTITNYCVTPIVGTFPWPYELKAQPEEVSRIFSIPLAWIANPDNHTVQKRNIQHQGKPIPVIHFKPYDGEILWGASARMTMLLLEAIGLSQPENRYR